MREAVGRILVVATALCVCFSAARAGDAYQQFDNEEIKPYIKVMKGPWVNNTVTGGPGDYRLSVTLPKGAEYVVGMFDHKINRDGPDARSAVVLVDGVNPLAPGEAVNISDIGSSDLSWMRKIAFDGLTFNSRDSSGRDCCVKVVDAKEEYEFGPVKPFIVPKGRSGNLGRIDIHVFKGPATPANPGDVIQYGQPVTKFTVTMSE